MAETEKEKINGWQISDLPIRHSEEEYEEARKEIVNKIKQVPEIIALFEFGYIPVPGISDMDFRAVFPDDAEKMYMPREPELSDKTKYLMEHNVFILSEKHYKKSLYFDPWTWRVWPDGHRLLFQREGIERDLNFEKIKFTKEEEDALSIGRIEEALTGIFSLMPFYVRKELPVRTVFEVLKDCVYMTREINLISDRKIDPSFSQDFQELRASWFGLDKEEGAKRLIDVFHRGLACGFEIAFSLSDWLSKYSQIEPSRFRKTGPGNASYLDKKNKNVYLISFGEKRVFTNAVDTPQKAMEMSLKSCRKIKKGKETIDFYIAFLPFEMSSMILGLARESGILSDNLRKDIYTNQKEVPVLIPKILREKNRMINEITEIYNKKQVIGVGGKGWVFGNNRFGYLFQEEGWKRKVLNFLFKVKFWRTVNKIK